MKTLSAILLFCSLSSASSFHSGVLAGAANDLKSAGQVSSYPVRHPRKSAQKVYGAGKSAGKASYRAVKASAKFAAQL